MQLPVLLFELRLFTSIGAALPFLRGPARKSLVSPMLFNAIVPFILALTAAVPSFAVHAPRSPLDGSATLSLRNDEWNVIGERAVVSLDAEASTIFRREDPEFVVQILRRAAEQELERRANKLRKKPPPKPPTCMDKLKCALGLKQPPPPKKTTWEKVKAAVGKKPPPPPPKKTAWDKMKSAVGIKPPPPPPPPPKKTAWQKVKAAVSKKPPPLPPRPPPKKTTWQKVASKVGVKARSDPELETMMRREAALALESRIDIAEHERRDLTSLIMREAEFVELD
ncbi:hypothetical protein C8Q72DRAFT_889249 [Fomitopsis betulina]|nr:hypothetical protein C8Q72DRAFT_889249 [Fomitopsis betulina]